MVVDLARAAQVPIARQKCLERTRRVAPRAPHAEPECHRQVRVVVLDETLAADALTSLQPVAAACATADSQLSALRPRDADQVAAALVDPEGFLVLRYAAGYDGNGLRKDISRVLR